VTGMVDVATFLSDNGIVVDPNFKLMGLTAISADGSTLIGLGRWQDNFDLATYRITVPEPTSIGALAVAGLTLLRRRGR